MKGAIWGGGAAGIGIGSITAALVLLLAGAGGVAQEPPKGPDPGRGKAVYEARCVVCHGADGRGLNGRLAVDLVAARERWERPDAALIQSVQSGVPGTAMPPWGGVLSEDELRDVVAYMRATFGPRP